MYEEMTNNEKLVEYYNKNKTDNSELRNLAYVVAGDNVTFHFGHGYWDFFGDLYFEYEDRELVEKDVKDEIVDELKNSMPSTLGDFLSTDELVEEDAIIEIWQNQAYMYGRHESPEETAEKEDMAEATRTIDDLVKQAYDVLVEFDSRHKAMESEIKKETEEAYSKGADLYEEDIEDVISVLNSKIEIANVVLDILNTEIETAMEGEIKSRAKEIYGTLKNTIEVNYPVSESISQPLSFKRFYLRESKKK
jgi:hypothetical protein